MNYLQGERVLILGLGISGLAMARWCASCGAFVRVADTRENPSGLQVLKEQMPELEFIGGKLSADLVSGGITRVLRSPGLMPNDEGLQAVLAKAKEAGISIGAELDLFTEALTQIDIQKSQAEELVRLQAQEERALEEESDAAVESVDDESVEKNENADFDALLDDLSAEEEEGAQTSFIKPLPPVLGYKPKVIAITGTNGKTTVTSLTAVLVKRAGKTVVAAGNIGLAMMDALTECLSTKQLPQVWVLELSSFQLNDAKSFEPTAATILNISQDHLEWHGSMSHYAQAKSHIFGTKTMRVLNRDDMGVMEFVPPPVEEVVAKRSKRADKNRSVALPLITFGTDVPTQAGDFGLVESGGALWLAQALEANETTGNAGLTMNLLMPVDALHIRGRHNASNALAALALGTLAGCEMGLMLRGLKDYKGEPHRVEFVSTVDGVDYIDDSKGTNVGATAAAIAGLGVDHRIVLILGGQGKGQDFLPLADLVQEHVKTVVLIGQDAPLIKNALEKTNVPLLDAQTLTEAVALSATHVVSGDIVLLSPACASLDMFKDYVHRSQVFVEAVQALKDKVSLDVRGGEL